MVTVRGQVQEPGIGIGLDVRLVVRGYRVMVRVSVQLRHEDECKIDDQGYGEACMMSRVMVRGQVQHPLLGLGVR